MSVNDQTASPLRALTDGEGRFHFVRVPAGNYRLRLERIGYQRVLSPIVSVQRGETVFQDILGTIEPIQLAEIMVWPAGDCLTGGQLETHPELQALWNEAQKGVEIRRAFELQYRFATTLRQDMHVRQRLLRDNRQSRDTTLINEPDSVLVRDQRRQAIRQVQGYAQDRSVLRLPNEKELFDDRFLRDHCLETAVGDADGALEMRFRPVRPREDRVDIRGRIWLDADTYLMQRLEVEYLEDGKPFARAEVAYSDIEVGGSAIRLPSKGHATVRPRRAAGVLVTESTATFTLTYRDFEQVRSGY